MTSICQGGGPSGPKDSTNTLVVFGALAIGSYLNNKGLGWAYGVAPAIGTLTFNMPSFCAGEPPALPVITAGDVLNWFNPLNDQGSVQLRVAMTQTLQAMLWYDLCQCTSGPQPAAPPPPALPPGVVLNPPALTPPATVQACYVVSRNVGHPATNPWEENVPLVIPAGRTATSAELASFWLPNGIGNPASATVDMIATRQDSFRVAETHAVYSPSGAQPPIKLALPLDTMNIFLRVTPSIFPNIMTYAYQLAIFCDSDRPDSTVPTCCPPDQVSLELAQQILKLTTLMQRQLAPFSYIPGAVHPGLSGRGELVVQGLLGVKLQPTVITTGQGVELGDPTEYFEMGWFAWGGADGFDNRIRLTHSPQVSFPPVAGQYTRLGYSFPPGLVVTITELVREH